MFDSKELTHVTGASLALFAAAVNTAIAAGKIPVGAVRYKAATTTYSCMFGTPKYRKSLPAFVGGEAFHEAEDDLVTEFAAVAARRPVVLVSTEVLASENQVMIVGYRLPA